MRMTMSVRMSSSRRLPTRVRKNALSRLISDFNGMRKPNTPVVSTRTTSPRSNPSSRREPVVKSEALASPMSFIGMLDAVFEVSPHPAVYSKYASKFAGVRGDLRDEYEELCAKIDEVAASLEDQGSEESEIESILCRAEALLKSSLSREDA